MTSTAEVQAFGKIPPFLQQIKAANNGSATNFAATEDGEFGSACLRLAAVSNAFINCRPILIVDTFHIKSKFGSNIKAARGHALGD